MSDDQEDQSEREASKRPRVLRWAVLLSVSRTVFGLIILGAVIASALAIFHPDTPLSREWNPTARLSVADPVTPLTMWKLRAAIQDPQSCIDALQTGAAAGPRPPLEDSENCHIRNRVSVSQVGGMTALGPPLMETSCATALRLAMWEEHGVQPAAREFFGQEVRAIRQIGSYNCRPIRTTSGNSTRWSTHATADAVDITGFDLNDGTRIRLIGDWDGDPKTALFLREVRDSACKWFVTTLSPDYNSLHADHFHLQARGWGACR